MPVKSRRNTILHIEKRREEKKERTKRCEEVGERKKKQEKKEPSYVTNSCFQWRVQRIEY
jgi:hypothetical protein